MNLLGASLQDLPLEILLEIAKLHPWVACELSKTIRTVGIYSLENDVKRWYKVEENKETFILVKSSKEPYYEKLPHSWDDYPAVINYYGSKWYKMCKLHRDNDKPAVIDRDGTQWWFKESKRHRDGDKPAVIYGDGTQLWYKEGKMHRDNDKPAATNPNGGQAWYKEDNRHRDDDKPAVIESNGDLRWFKNDEEYFST